MIEHTIPQSAPEMPLERYLRRAWPLWPNYLVRSLLKKRDVKRAGIRLGAKDAVRGGDALTLYLPDHWRVVPAETAFDDGHLLAAVKPQGLPVDADADGIGADTLLERIRLLAPEARLCHRLDAQAGGLVLAARDDRVYEGLLDVFRTHALQKTYLANAKGGFPPSDAMEATLRAYLKKDPRRAVVRVTDAPRPGAKEIITRYRVLGEENGVARLALEPITGRTHQLRAHMAFIGHPLLGDDLYGDRSLNHTVGGPLRLWCFSMTLNENGPLPEYGGMTLTAPEPGWWTTAKGNA